MKIFTPVYILLFLISFIFTENIFPQNFQKNPMSDTLKTITDLDKAITDSVKSNTDSAKVTVVKIDSLKKKTLTKKNTKSDTLFNKDDHPQDITKGDGYYIYSKNGKSVLRIYGSIRAFGSYDFDGLSGGTSFAISNIPVGPGRNDQSTFFMTANITRFGFESRRKFGFGNVFMKIETDFNGNNSTQFRIRHAFGQAVFLLAGQTWTVFSNVESIPNTVDLDGPPTAVTLRTVQLRFFKDFSKSLHFKASIEAPKVSFSAPDSVTIEQVNQNFPDVALNLKKDFKNFEVSAASVFKSIKVIEISGSVGALKGGGVFIGGKSLITKGLTLYFQALYGKGISSYLNISNNTATDVVLNVQTGNYVLTTSYGGFAALSQKLFKGHLDLNVIYGQINYDYEDYYPGSTFKSGQYFAFNAFYLTRAEFKLGIEYTYGFKRSMNNESGNANRTAFTFYYDF